MRMKTALLVVLALILTPFALLAEETLSNTDVVKMSAAGLGEDLIIAKVREAPEVAFALEVNDLVSLRQAGVSERIVQAMLERKGSSQNKCLSSDPPQWDESCSSTRQENCRAGG